MEYYIIDTETTGMKAGFHEITEISILRCKDLYQCTWLVKIKHPERANEIALQVTNKTVGELMSRGRYIDEVLPEVNEFISQGDHELDEICMIAHNASFDRLQMEAAFKKANIKFNATYWLCTKQMATRFYKKVLGLKKTSVALNNIVVTAGIKGIETDNLHSADVDVRNTYRLWNHMHKVKGMSNAEFIKMSPTLMNDLGPTKPITKKSKVGYDMSDLETTEDVISDSFEEDEEF